MSDMKCPFCQQELRKIHPTYVICDNCRITGEDKLWQELIRTRKEKEDKQAVLNGVVDMLKTLNQRYALIMGKDVIKETVRLLEQKKVATMTNMEIKVILEETDVRKDFFTSNRKENNLKCPICGEKIEHIEDGWCNCKNRCIGSGSVSLWQALIDTKKKLDVAMDGLKRIEKLTEPSYKNRNLEALALAVNTFSGSIIEQINNKE